MLIMETNSLNFESILNIIFKTTTKSAQFFADCYLKKDLSIISRWKNNIVVPKIEDLLKIAEFAVSESTGVQRIVMKDEIKKILKGSPIKKDILEVILEKENFEDFLIETLSALSIDYEYIISENDQLKPCDNKTQQNKNNAAVDLGTYVKALHDNAEDVAGNYTGVVQFDLLMLKQKGKDSKKFEDNAKKDIDISFSAKQGDLNKISKYILNRMTIGIIVLVSISGFLIAQASDNNHSKGPNSSKGVIPTVAVTTAADPTPEEFKTHAPNEADMSKLNKTPVLKSETLADDSNIRTQTPILTPAPTPSPVQKAKESLSSKKPAGTNTTNVTDNDNNNSTNTGVINNFNINFEGNDNDLAVGNSTIIREDD